MNHNEFIIVAYVVEIALLAWLGCVFAALGAAAARYRNDFFDLVSAILLFITAAVAIGCICMVFGYQIFPLIKTP